MSASATQSITMSKSSNEATVNDLISSQSKSNTVQTYSKVISNSMFPKLKQAIVIDTVEGIDIKTHLKAIAAKTTWGNLIAASKISQNRLCCYLFGVDMVDKFTSEGNNVVVIGEQKLKMRPFISKSKRIIFSNVHPCIPYDEILGVLKAKGINPKSRMSFIRLGIEEEGCSHILSFRRQLYIDPEDINKLPKEIVLNYEDMIHHIYISTDKITCFLCNQEGHTAKYCNSDKSSQVQYSEKSSEINSQPKISDEAMTQNAKDIEQGVQEQGSSHDEIPCNTINTTQPKQQQHYEFNGQQLFNKAKPDENTKKNKRNISLSTTSSDSNIMNLSQTVTLKSSRQESKKKKSSHHKGVPDDLQIMIETAATNITEESKAMYPLTIKEMGNFLADSYNYDYKTVKKLSEKYHENTSAIIVMLTDVHANIVGRDIKRRITNIIKQLKRSGEMEIEAGESSNSESQTE